MGAYSDVTKDLLKKGLIHFKSVETSKVVRTFEECDASSDVVLFTLSLGSKLQGSSPVAFILLLKTMTFRKTGRYTISLAFSCPLIFKRQCGWIGCLALQNLALHQWSPCNPYHFMRFSVLCQALDILLPAEDID
ncbi:hypothetical protein TNCV_943191 [Trichonephila clavipes]|nr:hypothetical protein TNCV_943191 [Trichonephila clavipes]